MTSPYDDLGPRAFWRSAVAEREPLDPGDLYRPRFKITRDMRIVTAGSCFAQHIGRALVASGFNVVDGEPFPGKLEKAAQQRFGYGIYSGRYGNIYTARHLLQLLQEAHGRAQPACPVWEKNGRFYDAMRPNVEPDGLGSPELVIEHRKLHLDKVRKLVRRCDLFVFTFGLTESWIHHETGTVYPTAPGAIAGEFDAEVFAFHNLSYEEIKADFQKVMKLLRRFNPDLRFLITVSPVPLTATATGQHVEVATSLSKSVLRAVCGSLYDLDPGVDYFPSYEIITSSNNRGAYFKANKRSVSDRGVQTAMNMFLDAHRPPKEDDTGLRAERGKKGRQTEGQADPDDVVCEEELLEAFAK